MLRPSTFGVNIDVILLESKVAKGPMKHWAKGLKENQRANGPNGRWKGQCTKGPWARFALKSFAVAWMQFALPHLGREKAVESRLSFVIGGEGR